MLIRLGYVAISLNLEEASSSKTVTVKTFSGLKERDPEAALNKVRRTARENLNNTLRILRHNQAHGIKVYRLSSKVIPLATHPLLREWDYLRELKPELEALGKYIKANKMRVSLHPDHYTLINSPRDEVLESSLRDLRHHAGLFTAMGLGVEAKLVMHIGGGYKDKEKAMQRFIDNWKYVPDGAAGRLCLENDDRTFNVSEVLQVSKSLSLPVVFDAHHHRCNRSGGDLKDILSQVFATWAGSGLAPKVHVSSPRECGEKRSHHDFVRPEDAVNVLKPASGVTEGLDVMLEAKQKDRALFKLSDALASMPGFTRISLGVLEFDADCVLS